MASALPDSLSCGQERGGARGFRAAAPGSSCGSRPPAQALGRRAAAKSRARPGHAARLCRLEQLGRDVQGALGAQQLRQVGGRRDVVEQQPLGQQGHVGPGAAAACGARARDREGEGRMGGGCAGGAGGSWGAGLRGCARQRTQAAALGHVQLFKGEVPGQLCYLRPFGARGSAGSAGHVVSVRARHNAPAATPAACTSC
jgi:hypothetical protein